MTNAVSRFGFVEEAGLDGKLVGVFPWKVITDDMLREDVCAEKLRSRKLCLEGTLGSVPDIGDGLGATIGFDEEQASVGLDAHLPHRKTEALARSRSNRREFSQPTSYDAPMSNGSSSSNFQGRRPDTIATSWTRRSSDCAISLRYQQPSVLRTPSATTDRPAERKV